MRRFRTRLSARILSATLSLAMAAGPVLSGASVAHAVEAPAAAPAAHAPSVPSLVRRAPERDTPVSRTWLASDGSYRAEVYASPVQFKDADGLWREVNTALVPDSEPGRWRTSATPVAVSFGVRDERRFPVELGSGPFRIGMDLLGGEERPTLVSDAEARFAAVAAGTDLVWQVHPDGVKETLLLSDAEAPTSFTFEITSGQLEVRTLPGAGWGLFRHGATRPELVLGALSVFDSAQEPAACTDARMIVVPHDGGARVTYLLSRSWLQDPERVFPVVVDPSVSLGAQQDTYVDSGYPTTSFGSAGGLYVGKSSGYRRSYMQFDLSALGQGAQITSATCQTYFTRGTAQQDTKPVYMGSVESAWSESSTWNTKPSHSYMSTKQIPRDAGWALWSVPTTLAQTWLDDPDSNYGVAFYKKEDGSEDAHGSRCIVSSEEMSANDPSPYRPKFVATYTADPPSAPSSLTASTSGLQWWRAADRNDDGIPDRACDVPLQGRGTVALSWPEATTAAGYRIYLHDGSTWRQVGQRTSMACTTWTSEASGIWPSDTEIASWPDDYPGNPFAGASSPSTASIEDTVSLPSGFADDFGGDGSGAGLAVSDGSFLYVREWGDLGGPHTWVKIGTGMSGTTKDRVYGSLGVDLSEAPARSAFYRDGFLYSGYTEDSTSVTGVWKGSSALSVDTTTLGFSHPLLDRGTGTTVTAPSGEVLLASDGDRIFSVAYATTSPYRGFRVREFTADGVWIADHDVACPAYYTGGVFATSDSLYLVEWSGTDAARVTRVSTKDFAVIGQWTIDQASRSQISGCWDAAHDTIWLGRASGSGQVLRYSGPGLDLRDDPTPLYAKTPGTAMDSRTDTMWRVVPYNSFGTPAFDSCATATPTLPCRTVGVADEPHHTSEELGQAAGHGLTVHLDTGELAISVTDLEISSFGPRAALERTYVSSSPTANAFAPGWRFSYEQSIETSTHTYIDAAGERHRFTVATGAFRAPVGSSSQLASSAAGFSLTEEDGSSRSFDASGVLVREADAFGNHVDYDRSTPGHLLIRAANGQVIDVELDSSGSVTRAQYATSDGTREVAFSTSPTPTVTYFPGTEDENEIAYAYASSYLTTLIADSIEDGSGSGSWGFAYAGGGLSHLRRPGYADDSDRAVSFDYGSGTATMTARGLVAGAASDIITTWRNNPTGTCAERSVPHTPGAQVASTAFEYSYTGAAILETAPAGGVTRRSVDATGHVTSQWDPLGRLSTFAYDSRGGVVRETDPRGCITYRTFDASGALLVEERTLTAAGARSRTECSYNASGTMTSQRSRIDTDTWTETEYSDFAPCGEPRTTTQKGVKLAPSVSATDLVTTRGFDAFGNVISETDASGTVTAQHTYSPSTRLRQLASEDARGAVTHRAFDPLGRETESSRTAGGHFADWVSRTFDAEDRELATAYRLSATETAYVTSTRYDAAGRTWATVHSLEGTTLAWLDASGAALRTWGPALSASQVETASTRCAFDAQGRETLRLEPGADAAHATTTTYDAAGQVTLVTRPDGSFSRFLYDDGGNEIACGTPFSASEVATATKIYDIGGRLAASTDSGGFTTYFVCDLLGRQLTASGDGTTPTVSAYNTAGQTLSVIEPDGIVKSSAYDACGRVVSECTSVTGAANAYVWRSYDAAGGLVREEDSSGTVTVNSLDDFGRTTESTQTKSGRIIRRYAAAYDSLSRVTSSTETVMRTSSTVVYAGAGGKTSSARTTYGDATVTAQMDRFVEEVTRTAQAGSLASTRTVTSRDAARRATGICVDAGGGSLSWTRVFDGAGRLATVTGTGMGTNGATYSFSASTGRKSAETLDLAYSGADTTASYVFDADGRLDTVAVGGIPCNYSFDAAGNITNAVVTGGGNGVSDEFTYGSHGNYGGPYALHSWRWNRGAGATTADFSFDAKGRRVTATDALAPVSGSVRALSFAYDSADRLTTLTIDAYPYSTPETTAVFAYDATGQRTRSIISTPGGPSSETTFTYEGLDLLAYETSSAAGILRVVYVHDEEGRPYAAAVTLPGSATPVFVGLVTTDRGDVVELIDAAGDAFAHFAYDAYGNPTSSQNQATALLTASTAAALAEAEVLRYAGYAWDGFSGLYYLSARYYDPATYQFISKDPAKADGEASAYQYCGGDPVGKVDPSGLYCSVLAVNYALLWAKKRNPLYPVIKDNDCTNFVSQCLVAGGVPMDSKWFVNRYGNASLAWCNAQSFYAWLSKRSRSVAKVRKNASGTYPNVLLGALPGDVISADWRGDSGMDHTAIVTQATRSATLVSYHTKDQRNVPWSVFLSKNGPKADANINLRRPR